MFCIPFKRNYCGGNYLLPNTFQMKMLKTMSEKQILGLSNIQVQKIIQYRKAQEGVRLIENPVPPTYEQEIKEDVPLYSIKNLNGFSFVELKQAEAMLSAINGAMPDDVLYGRYSGSPKLRVKLSGYDKDESLIVIEKKMVYSMKVKEEAEGIDKRNDSLKKQFNQDVKDYEQYQKDVQWILDEAWDKVTSVREKYFALSRLQNSYAEYLELAEKKEEIATKFLLKANDLEEGDLEIIKGEKIVIEDYNREDSNDKS